MQGFFKRKKPFSLYLMANDLILWSWRAVGQCNNIATSLFFTQSLATFDFELRVCPKICQPWLRAAFLELPFSSPSLSLFLPPPPVSLLLKPFLPVIIAAAVAAAVAAAAAAVAALILIRIWRRL